MNQPLARLRLAALTLALAAAAPAAAQAEPLPDIVWQAAAEKKVRLEFARLYG